MYIEVPRVYSNRKMVPIIEHIGARVFGVSGCFDSTRLLQTSSHSEYRILDSWTQVVRGCIRLYNNQYFDKIADISVCMQRCKAAVGFTCRSIDFNRVTKRCNLSSKRKATAGNSYYEPCNITGEEDEWLYRYCKWLSHTVKSGR